MSMTMNDAVLPVAALLWSPPRSKACHELCGTIQNGGLKEFMVRNTYIYPPKPSLRIADIFAYLGTHAEIQLDLDLRLSHAGSRRVRRSSEGSPTALADGVEYVRAGLTFALDVDRFAPRLSFSASA